MRCVKRSIAWAGTACIQWCNSFADEARVRAIDSLEQRSIIICPVPPLSITRFRLFVTLFQQR